MNSRPPNMHDVAKHAGVSQRTVSNVVNNYAHVSAKMRARVQAAIDELGYRPNVVAQRLRQGRTGIIALAVPNLSWPYFGELAHLIQHEAHKHGFTLLIVETEGSKEYELEVLSGFKTNLIDGLILSPIAVTQDDLEQMKLNLPLVLIGEKIRNAGLLHLEVDNHRAARLVANHLYHQGARSFLILGSTSTHVTSGPGMGRKQGFIERLTELELPPEWPQVEVSPWTYSGAYSAMSIWLENNPLPDAIYSMNDIMAAGALRALGDIGATVPGDVLLSGWDDTDLARYSLPSITSMKPDKSAIAKKSVSGLAGLISGEPIEQTDVYVGHKLMLRESTGSN